MTPFPSTLFAGKRYAVVGLGQNGRPAADALRAMGADVTAWDDNESARAGAKDLALRDLREGALDFDASPLGVQPRRDRQSDVEELRANADPEDDGTEEEFIASERRDDEGRN